MSNYAQFSVYRNFQNLGSILPTIRETAYPCFRTNTAAKDLAEVYTPNEEELAYARSFIRTKDMELCFFILLKSFQRLGHFVPVISVPNVISKHIAGVLGCVYAPEILEEYDRSRNKWKHVRRIRQFLGIKSVGKDTRNFLRITLRQAAWTKQDIVDIINVGIEELVRNHFELPAFDTLLREAKKARSKTNKQIYQQIYDRVDEQTRLIVDEIFKTDPATKRSLWNQLRQDTGKPTLKELKELINRLFWLHEINRFGDPFHNVPYGGFCPKPRNFSRPPLSPCYACLCEGKLISEFNSIVSISS